MNQLWSTELYLRLVTLIQWFISLVCWTSLMFYFWLAELWNNIGTFCCLFCFSFRLFLFTPPLSMYLAGSVSLAITRYMEGRKAGYCQTEENEWKLKRWTRARGKNPWSCLSEKWCKALRITWPLSIFFQTIKIRRAVICYWTFRNSMPMFSLHKQWETKFTHMLYVCCQLHPSLQ